MPDPPGSVRRAVVPDCGYQHYICLNEYVAVLLISCCQGCDCIDRLTGET